jgi:sulfatase modifying factor 1
MKKVIFIAALVSSIKLQAQLQLAINKDSGTAKITVSEIDSIRFNAEGTEMAFVAKGGSVETHPIIEIDSVIFSGEGSNPLVIETVLIPGGIFTMGSPESEPLRVSDEKQHEVTLSAFRLSKYEISNIQYATFLNANDIRSNGINTKGAYPGQVLIFQAAGWGLIWADNQWRPVEGKENNPVVNVTWFGAQEFATYAGGRLPTESEWEYACRGGSTTPFYTGSCLDNKQANYEWSFPYTGCSNSDINNPEQTQSVYSYAPNAYGLHNMYGNAYEWCSDWYGAYPTGAQTNPTGPATGTSRVIRGGGWDDYAQYCRSANRFNSGPGSSINQFGFRLAFAR